jgi:hypothetical protein
VGRLYSKDTQGEAARTTVEGSAMHRADGIDDKLNSTMKRNIK